MAAIQKIRSKGALLVLVIGLALFAFIAEELVRSISTTSAMNHNVAGKVNGKKFDAQEYQNLINVRTEIEKLVNGNELTSQQSAQLREQVWQEFVYNSLVAKEAAALGLQVTDGEVQYALQQGTAPSLQTLAKIFRSQQGALDFQQLQQFLKDYEKNVAQARQQGGSEAVSQFETIKLAYEDAVSQLRSELLATKYQMLLNVGIISDPVVAKVQYQKSNSTKVASVVAVPYSTVEDKEIKISDDDLKAAFATVKELYYSPYETVDLSYIYVNVEASAEDRGALESKMQGFEKQLAEGVDVEAVVRNANSEVSYVAMPMSKDAFMQKARDVAQRLDSVAVGTVVPTYYEPADNTFNTWKLVGTETRADSVLYRQIFAVAGDVEARKAQADSIYKALQGGASFKELAEKYQQRSDSMWLTSKMYEHETLDEMTINYMKDFHAIGAGETRVISNEQGAVVVQVLERRNMVKKYQVAIVKNTLHFSEKTYNARYNELTKFIGANQTLEALEKNAQRSGFQVNELPGYTESNGLQQSLIANLGGKARDAVMWAFNEAKEGEVSGIYECNQNAGLLVLVMKQRNDRGYRKWNDPTLKETLTSIATQQKKAALLAERTKGVKSLEDMKKQKGAVEAEIPQHTLAGTTSVEGVNVPEVKLTGVIARTDEGKTTDVVVGNGGVYIAKVTKARAANMEGFDANSMQRQMEQMSVRTLMNGVFSHLLRNCKMVDHRYQF